MTPWEHGLTAKMGLPYCDRCHKIVSPDHRPGGPTCKTSTTH